MPSPRQPIPQSTMMSPLTKSNPQYNKSPVGLSKSPNNFSLSTKNVVPLNNQMTMPQYHQNHFITQSNMVLSKPKSPNIPIKAKSPQMNKNKPSLNTIKEKQLTNYGRY